MVCGVWRDLDRSYCSLLLCKRCPSPEMMSILTNRPIERASNDTKANTAFHLSMIQLKPISHQLEIPPVCFCTFPSEYPRLCAGNSSSLQNIGSRLSSNFMQIAVHFERLRVSGRARSTKASGSLRCRQSGYAGVNRPIHVPCASLIFWSGSMVRRIVSMHNGHR